MPNFILTKSSIILCPHGGMVTHVPTSSSDERINGEVPMLMTDLYFVAGCPLVIGEVPSSCLRVIWLSGSVTKLINGIPVLINTSLGICQSVTAIPQGQPIIASFQTIVTD